MIGALVSKSSRACGTVNCNVDSDTFNTWLDIWLKEILVSDLLENFVIIMNNAVFHEGHRTKKY